MLHIGRGLHLLDGDIKLVNESVIILFFAMSVISMSADVAPPVPTTANAEKVPSESGPKPPSQDGSPILEDNSIEDVVTGSWYWHEGEIIASLLAFDAASRQK